jgi:mRNA-degrading endonuclease toxin of MazEF toxin-antitoxin module
VDVGDIFWCTYFPYTETNDGKARPVVIVGASPMGPGEDQVVVIVPISTTGALKRGDFAISNWEVCGLTSFCWVRARRVFAASPSVLGRRLGRLPNDVFNDVVDELAMLFNDV